MKEEAIESERCKRKQEVTNLKRTITELEKALRNSQERGSNLQNAVSIIFELSNLLRPIAYSSFLFSSLLILRLTYILIRLRYWKNLNIVTKPR